MADKWEVVGQKKQQKIKQKADKQKKDKEFMSQLEEEEMEKRNQEKQNFYNQYVQAVNQVKASDPTNNFVDGSMFSAFMDFEEEKLNRAVCIFLPSYLHVLFVIGHSLVICVPIRCGRNQ